MPEQTTTNGELRRLSGKVTALISRFDTFCKNWEDWRELLMDRIDRHGTRINVLEQQIAKLVGGMAGANPERNGVPVKYVVMLAAAVVALAFALLAILQMQPPQIP